MPVSQGSGGYMPGMTLRAWALVTAAGVLVKSYGVASVTKTGTGTYKLTMSGAAVSANAILKGVPKFGQIAHVVAGAIAGNDMTYVVQQEGMLPQDAAAHVEVYE